MVKCGEEVENLHKYTIQAAPIYAVVHLTKDQDKIIT
jgi:hypothetical protein